MKPFVWPAIGAQLDINDVAVAIPSPQLISSFLHTPFRYGLRKHKDDLRYEVRSWHISVVPCHVCHSVWPKQARMVPDTL